MSREVIRMLTDRARNVRKLASEGNIEAVVRTGLHKNPDVRRVINKVRANERREKTAKETEGKETAK